MLLLGGIGPEKFELDKIKNLVLAEKEFKNSGIIFFFFWNGFQFFLVMLFVSEFLFLEPKLLYL